MIVVDTNVIIAGCRSKKGASYRIDSLAKHIHRLAGGEGMSPSQFLASAAAEKVAVWETQDILKQRGALANPQAIRRILDKIPDVEPEHEWDRIPQK